MTNGRLENQGSVTMVRALVGPRAGIRERRIMNHPTAKLYSALDYPGCVKVVASFEGDCSFLVRLSDGEIVG